VVEALVKCGAFDALHENRASVWGSLDVMLEAGAAAQRDREIGQTNLFGNLDDGTSPEPVVSEAAPWTDRQRLEYEKEVLGFYVTGHPLSAVKKRLDRFADTKANDVEGKDGREIRAGGLLTSFRESRTRRGALMAFSGLEDLEGNFDLVVFSEPYARYGSLLKSALEGTEESEGPIPVLVSGTLEVGDPPKILVREVLELSRAEEKLATNLSIKIRSSEATEDRLVALRQLLEARPGECAVTLHVVIPDRSETILAVNGVRGIRPDDALVADLDALFGRQVTGLSL
jgi:DNA polymerase-3 subunit alpha